MNWEKQEELIIQAHINKVLPTDLFLKDFADTMLFIALRKTTTIWGIICLGDLLEASVSTILCFHREFISLPNVL